MCNSEQTRGSKGNACLVHLLHQQCANPSRTLHVDSQQYNAGLVDQQWFEDQSFQFQVLCHVYLKNPQSGILCRILHVCELQLFVPSPHIVIPNSSVKWSPPFQQLGRDGGQSQWRLWSNTQFPNVVEIFGASVSHGLWWEKLSMEALEV